MKSPWHVLRASAIVAATAAPAALAPTGAAAADDDTTPSILAGSDVVLGGSAVVNVPPGTHTYSGVISGQGSLRVTGTGTLVLTKDGTFTLPRSRQGQSVGIPGGNHPDVVVSNPDRGFLFRTVEAQVTDAALPPVAAAATDAVPRTTELKRSLAAAGSALLARARDAAVVRPDLTAADLVPLMCGIAHAVSVHGGAPTDRVDTARRYLATLLEGLRTTPPSP